MKTTAQVTPARAVIPIEHVPSGIVARERALYSAHATSVRQDYGSAMRPKMNASACDELHVWAGSRYAAHDVAEQTRQALVQYFREEGPEAAYPHVRVYPGSSELGTNAVVRRAFVAAFDSLYGEEYYSAGTPLSAMPQMPPRIDLHFIGGLVLTRHPLCRGVAYIPLTESKGVQRFSIYRDRAIFADGAVPKILRWALPRLPGPLPLALMRDARQVPHFAWPFLHWALSGRDIETARHFMMSAKRAEPSVETVHNAWTTILHGLEDAGWRAADFGIPLFHFAPHFHRAPETMTISPAQYARVLSTEHFVRVCSTVDRSETLGLWKDALLTGARALPAWSDADRCDPDVLGLRDFLKFSVLGKKRELKALFGSEEHFPRVVRFIDQLSLEGLRDITRLLVQQMRPNILGQMIIQAANVGAEPEERLVFDDTMRIRLFPGRMLRLRTEYDERVLSREASKARKKMLTNNVFAILDGVDDRDARAAEIRRELQRPVADLFPRARGFESSLKQNRKI